MNSTKSSLLWKFITVVLIIIFTLVSSVITVEASEIGSNVIDSNTIDTGQAETDTKEEEIYEEGHTYIEPNANQVFKLKATKVNDFGEQGKQVIMELWGYNIDFARINSKI